MRCALVSISWFRDFADQCSDLAALDLNFWTYQAEGARFIIPGLTKSRRTGPPIEAFYTSFPGSPKLWLVEALKEYEQAVGEALSHREKQSAFHHGREPHDPVKPCTIGRWLKRTMMASEIDTSNFSAYSTRGAATSKARPIGVLTVDILKAANWSSQSTFYRYYHRPTFSTVFGHRVLGQQW